MTSTRSSRTTSKNGLEALPREEYSAFIAQVHLRDVWLARSRVQNNFGPTMPTDAQLRIDNHPSWETLEGGFRASSHYELRVTSETSSQLAVIEATFAVDYLSEHPMTDEFFGVFGEVNLPLNTWPFFREYVASTLSRMNWMPFSLPALKRGIGVPTLEGSGQTPAKRTAKSGTKKASRS